MTFSSMRDAYRNKLKAAPSSVGNGEKSADKWQLEREFQLQSLAKASPNLDRLHGTVRVQFVPFDEVNPFYRVHMASSLQVSKSSYRNIIDNTYDATANWDSSPTGLVPDVLAWFRYNYEDTIGPALAKVLRPKPVDVITVNVLEWFHEIEVKSASGKGSYKRVVPCIPPDRRGNLLCEHCKKHENRFFGYQMFMRLGAGYIQDNGRFGGMRGNIEDMMESADSMCACGAGEAVPSKVKCKSCGAYNDDIDVSDLRGVDGAQLLSALASGEFTCGCGKSEFDIEYVCERRVHNKYTVNAGCEYKRPLGRWNAIFLLEKTGEKTQTAYVSRGIISSSELEDGEKFDCKEPLPLHKYLANMPLNKQMSVLNELIKWTGVDVAEITENPYTAINEDTGKPYMTNADIDAALASVVRHPGTAGTAAAADAEDRDSIPYE